MTARKEAPEGHRQLHLYFPVETIAAIDFEAKRRRVSRVEVIRDACSRIQPLGRPAWALLSERELDALALLLGDGELTQKQVGERLGLSVRTVEDIVGRVYRKLGVRTPLGAYKLLQREGAL